MSQALPHISPPFYYARSTLQLLQKACTSFVGDSKSKTSLLVPHPTLFPGSQPTQLCVLPSLKSHRPVFTSPCL